jgi:hypothetical protein
MPIRFRLAALFSAGTALLVVLGGFTFLHVLDGQLQESVDTGLRAQADALSQLVQNDPQVPISVPDRPNGVAQLVDPAGTLVWGGGLSSALLTSDQQASARQGLLFVTRTLGQTSRTTVDHGRVLARTRKRGPRTRSQRLDHRRATGRARSWTCRLAARGKRASPGRATPSSGRRHLRA